VPFSASTIARIRAGSRAARFYLLAINEKEPVPALIWSGEWSKFCSAANLLGMPMSRQLKSAAELPEESVYPVIRKPADRQS